MKKGKRKGEGREDWEVSDYSDKNLSPELLQPVYNNNNKEFRYLSGIRWPSVRGEV